MRYVILLLALAWPAMFVAPAAGQEPYDLTFEGEVAETFSTELPAVLGPGFIRITLTPSMDGVLRAEVADVLGVNTFRNRAFERVATKTKYYWPPLPIEDGTFALSMTLTILSLSDYVTIEGEVTSGSELRGTLRSSFSPVTTTWSASGPADTPPGAQDRPFDAVVEGGGTVSVALAENGLSITAFELKELPLDPCSPGETLSVRAFFEPGVGLDRAGAGFTGRSITRSVGLDVAEVDGTRASGTLYWSSGFYRKDCRFEVGWQTEPFPTATATALPTATPLPTPVEEPIELPPAGSGGTGGVPVAGLAILVACLGVALATAGLFRMRS